MKKRIFILNVMLLIFLSCATNSKFMMQDNSSLSITQIGNELAKSFGISKEEAKYIATEYAKRKWKEDPYFKILNCEKYSDYWYVVCFADDGLTGWGCKIRISDKGKIINDEFIPGL